MGRERPASAVVIRPATAEDAEAIHAALLGIADALDERDRIVSTTDDIRHYGFGDHPAFKVLVAESGTKLAGICLYFPSFSTWFGRPGVYVQDLYVAPEFRNAGVAEKLMRALAKDTEQTGGTYIRLSVDDKNVAAQKFYARIGMKWSRSERIFVARHGDFLNLAQGGDEM